MIMMAGMGRHVNKDRVSIRSVPEFETVDKEQLQIFSAFVKFFLC